VLKGTAIIWLISWLSLLLALVALLMMKITTTKRKHNDGSGPLPGQLAQTASPQEIVANQLANLLAPAQAQGSSTVQQLLDELNARRGR
jgi:hypothetical protein